MDSGLVEEAPLLFNDLKTVRLTDKPGEGKGQNGSGRAEEAIYHPDKFA